MKQAINELRQEYFELKESMYKVFRHFSSSIKCYLNEFEYKLEGHERIDIETRMKDCDSAIDSLRRKQPGRDFENDKTYSLKQLRDLVGVRILAFPVSVMESVNSIIRENFGDWQTDHDKHGDMKIYKYYGNNEYTDIPCEIQVVSMLTGKFWDVEHSALYKPRPAYKGVLEGDLKMKRLYKEVMNKLAEFEAAFEDTVKNG